MLQMWIYGLLSVIIVSIISFAGAITLAIKESKLKKVLLYFVSFSAGALIGDVFIHLLPSAVKDSGFTLPISIFIISGIAFSFIVEKVIHWRHCHLSDTPEHVHPFAIINLWGDTVHNFIDGLIIGASYLASLEVGIATTLAVILHEIPQEIGDFAVLLHGGYSKYKAILFNFLSAVAAVLGLIVSFFVSQYLTNITYFMIPFSAGTLIYIATADLIPELHKEVKARKSLLQFAILIAGILMMMSLLLLE